jgi:hypothetical protein
MPIQFATPVQQVCYDRVNRFLTEALGERYETYEDIPSFSVNVGSAIAHIIILPWDDDKAVINTRAYVVEGANITPELLRFLLTSNDLVPFGGFGLDEDDGIFFEHNILGVNFDRDELLSSVTAVVRAADTYDDEIVEKYGGKRALDTLRGAKEAAGVA